MSIYECADTAALDDDTVRDDDDIIERYPRPTYVPPVPRTLEDLARSGDLHVEDTHAGIVCIDLTVRRSGITLYGSGYSLTEAIDDVADQLGEHTESINHLEDQGVDIWRLKELLWDDEDFGHPWFRDVPEPDYVEVTTDTRTQDELDEQLKLALDASDRWDDTFLPEAFTPATPIAAYAGEPHDTNGAPHPVVEPDEPEQVDAYLIIPIKVER